MFLFSSTFKTISSFGREFKYRQHVLNSHNVHKMFSSFLGQLSLVKEDNMFSLPVYHFKVILVIYRGIVGFCFTSRASRMSAQTSRL